MDANEILAVATDSMTVRRVYGEPIERDGVLVIPAAAVSGGGGSGGGAKADGEHGEGTGFGLSAKPVGAFVIKDGTVRWRPALDVNRTVLVGAGLVLSGVLAGVVISITAIRSSR
ncbi:spore germination protein GerW family protein [Nocardia sp. NPDC057227]|uniref:spore germination protein GerW family protein n=1 Tax=Nocardia sp. NPDC057227 TaxID=3346056 RepID=UPI00362BE72B